MTAAAERSITSRPGHMESHPTQRALAHPRCTLQLSTRLRKVRLQKARQGRGTWARQRSHLERKTGAMGETAEQGISGYQLLLTHMVYTILPVTIGFAAVATVLVHFDYQAYLVILGVASLAYAMAFQRGAAAIQEPSRTISAAAPKERSPGFAR